MPRKSIAKSTVADAADLEVSNEKIPSDEISHEQLHKLKTKIKQASPEVHLQVFRILSYHKELAGQDPVSPQGNKISIDLSSLSKECLADVIQYLNESRERETSCKDTNTVNCPKPNSTFKSSITLVKGMSALSIQEPLQNGTLDPFSTPIPGCQPFVGKGKAKARPLVHQTMSNNDTTGLMLAGGASVPLVVGDIQGGGEGRRSMCRSFTPLQKQIKKKLKELKSTQSRYRKLTEVDHRQISHEENDTLEGLNDEDDAADAFQDDEEAMNEIEGNLEGMSMDEALEGHPAAVQNELDEQTVSSDFHALDDDSPDGPDGQDEVVHGQDAMDHGTMDDRSEIEEVMTCGSEDITIDCSSSLLQDKNQLYKSLLPVLEKNGLAVGPLPTPVHFKPKKATKSLETPSTDLTALSLTPSSSPSLSSSSQDSATLVKSKPPPRKRVRTTKEPVSNDTEVAPPPKKKPRKTTAKISDSASSA